MEIKNFNRTVIKVALLAEGVDRNSGSSWSPT